MEDAGIELKVYTVTCGKINTLILASNTKEVIRKFFASFNDLRQAILKDEIVGSMCIKLNDTSINYSTLPFLLHLKALTLSQAIMYLSTNLHLSPVLCNLTLQRELQRTRWFLE